METKRLIVIGGANGAGKTTFARPYVDASNLPFLNADDLTQEFVQRGEPSPLIKAGRLFFARLNDFLDGSVSFVVESTLSGSYINKVASRAKRLGYAVEAYFIFIDSPEVCIDRVKLRVEKGGHTVPDLDIHRRFYRSARNFWNNFTDLTDGWILLYNGDEGFQQVAVAKGDEYEIQNDLLFDHFRKIITYETR